METNQQFGADTAAPRPLVVEQPICPNCHAGLLRGMRFCRACGFRLGEGVAEYVETMRFDGASLPVAHAHAAATTVQTPAPPTTTLAPVACRRRRAGVWRMRWLVWMMLALMFSSGGGSILLRRNLPQWIRQNVPIMFGRGNSFTPPAAPRSFFGTQGFTTVDEGAMVDAVVPNGPAASAGLIGGDIVTRFDGQAVESSDDMTRLLRTTPIGKIVEIVFLRDGALKTITLTTASSAAFNTDTDTLMGFAGHPQGFLGVDSMSRVHVPGSNIYGVRLGSVSNNRPADIAGLHRGDIVIEFDGTPIRTAEEFTARIRRATPGQTVNITVMRDGQQVGVPVKMGRR
jgi:membrane-associated protease RseP (regulator of RpoE activity)